jgi:hypothetical protein
MDLTKPKHALRLLVNRSHHNDCVRHAILLPLIESSVHGQQARNRDLGAAKYFTANSIIIGLKMNETLNFKTREFFVMDPMAKNLKCYPITFNIVWTPFAAEL